LKKQNNEMQTMYISNSVLFDKDIHQTPIIMLNNSLQYFYFYVTKRNIKEQ